MRTIYRVLSILGMIGAAWRGGFTGLAKNRARAAAHRTLARALRKVL